MKCLSPLSIKNPSLQFRNSFDKPFIEVSCGSCLLCKEQSKNEWIARAISHYKTYDDAGGKVIFVTLTYNRKSLPVFRPSADTGINPFSCFDKKHLDSFRKAINKKFETSGVTNKNSLGVSYLFCCEYGGNGTKRPHYHGLIFLPPCPGFDFDSLPRWIKDLWNVKRGYGYVFYSKYGAYVNDIRAVKYVCKYICKDTDFYNKPDVVKYLKFIRKSFDPNLSPSENSERRSFLRKEFKRFCPYHYQSQGFGLSMINTLSSDSKLSFFENVKKGIKDPSSVGSGSVFYYHVPRYIYNKLFRDSYKWTDKDGVEHIHYYLNDLGKEFESYCFNSKLIDKIAYFSHFTSDLTTPKFHPELSDLPCDPKKFGSFIRDLIDNDTYGLALYSMVYRGRYLSTSFLSYFKIRTLSDLFESAHDMYDYFNIDAPADFSGESLNIIMHFPELHKYDLAYSLISKVVNNFSNSVLQSDVTDFIYISNLKDRFYV